MKIAIFGTVGAGKSVVAQRIADQLTGYEVFPEPIDNNPYFDDYYQDMKTNVFKMQIYMLTARSIQLKQATNLKNVIFDRTLLEDPIFVKVNHQLKNMNDVDFQTYNDFYEHVVLPALADRSQFDLVIYLRVSTKKAVERIRERGRVQELETSFEYWDLLNHWYDDYYQQRKEMFNFLLIDAETDDLEAKMALIFAKIAELENAKNVTQSLSVTG